MARLSDRLCAASHWIRALAAVVDSPQPALTAPDIANTTSVGGAPPQPRPGKERRSRRRWPVALVVAVVAGSASMGAWAYLTASASPGSNGAAAATSVNQGATPAATATAVGREVSLSWGATTLANGQPVDGYIVSRYPNGGGIGTISPFGTCAGTVHGTNCVEDDVLPGQWQYTITPVIGTNWQGAASSFSGVVTVAPEVLSLSGSPFGAAAFTPNAQAAPGAIAGFAGNADGLGNTEGVSYRLDSGPGTPLAGSPASVTSAGSAAITSLQIPNAGDGGHTVYALGNAPFDPSQASAAIVIDTTAPTVSASAAPAANVAGWNNTAPVQVTLTETDPSPTSGNGTITYTTDGSDPTTSGTAHTYSGPFNLSAEGTTTIKFYGTDAAGNASSTQTQAVRIDTVAPTNSLSLTNVTGNAILSGSTLWYRGVSAGSFTIQNALTDTAGGSGPASSDFSPLAGTTTGWSFTHSTVTSGPPYVSNTFSWNAGTTSSPSETATGFDVAGNSTATTPAVTFTNDSTGPTGGSVDATGLSGTGSRYSTSTTLSIAMNAGSDASVGLATSGFQLLRDVAPLTSDGTSNGSCGSYSGSPTLLATDPTSPYTDNAASGIASGHCYRYSYVVSDKLGNPTTYTSPGIKVDTTGPSAPSLGFSASASAYYSGSGSTVFFRPAASGGFTVTASGSTDNDSGITGYTFPASLGTNWSTSGSGSSRTYNYTSGATEPGAQSVTAQNNAGGSSTGAGFTVTADSAAPTGGSVDATGLVGTGGRYSTSTTLSIAFTKGSDGGGSGLAATGAQLLRASATLSSSNGTSDGACGSYGSFAQVGSNDPTSPFTDNAGSGIVAGHCYKYEYLVRDNVGNVATYTSGDIKVDTTAPSAPSNATITPVTGTSFQSVSGNTIFYNPAQAGSFNVDSSTSDSESGIQQAAFPTPAGFTAAPPSGIVTSPNSGTTYRVTYSWSSNGASPSPGTQSITSTNNATLTATNSTAFTITKDGTAPTGGSITANSGTTYNTTGTIGLSVTNFTDSGSGIATNIVTRATGTLSSNSCGALSGATVISGTSDSGLANGCYQYTLTGTDNVGNTATAQSAIIKVDKTTPSVPTLAFGSFSNASVSGSTVYYRPSAASGSFTVTGSATDAETGIASYSFPTLPSGWTPIAGAFGVETYSWSAPNPTAPSGNQAVQATNNAGLTSSGTNTNNPFTIVADSTAPSGGSVTVPSFSTTTTVSVTFTAGTDSQSGVNTGSGQLARATGTYNAGAGTCSGFSSFSNIGSAGPTSPFSDTGLTSGNCYEYQYTVADNVGNTVTYASGAVAVDSSPTITAFSTANGAGKTAGKIDSTDTITITFSKQIKASSVCSAWTDGSSGTQTASTGSVVTVNNTGPGNSDILSFTTAPTTCTTFNFGSIDLGSSSYVTSSGGAHKPVTFSNSTISYNGTTNTLTITLGTLGGTGTEAVVASSVATLTLSTSVTDIAGNPTSPNTNATGNVQQF